MNIGDERKWVTKTIIQFCSLGGGITLEKDIIIFINTILKYFSNKLSSILPPEVLKFLQKLPGTPEYKTIRYQLAKSATSSGANYEESQAGSSKADFTNKVRIAFAPCNN